MVRTGLRRRVYHLGFEQGQKRMHSLVSGPTGRADLEKRRRRFSSDPVSAHASSISVVPIAELPFGEFPAFLCLEGQGGDWSCFESLQADLFAGFVAIAVGPLADPGECRVDLAKQFSLTVPRAQLEAEF